MSVRWKDKTNIGTVVAADKLPITKNDDLVDYHVTPVELSTYMETSLAGTFDASGTAAAAVAAHEAEVDPHPQYLTDAEADALFLTPAEGDALFLTPAEGNAAYQPLAANLTAWASEDPDDYSTTAEADALYQPLDAGLTDIAGLANTDGNIIVGNGTNWVAESGATARTSLGLGTGNTPQFTGIEVGNASDTTISRSAAGVIAVEGVPIYPNIPQNSQTSDYTLVLSDAQKHIIHPFGDDNPRTFTIPANASVAFPIGTAITFINRQNVLTIAITSDTLLWAPDGTTGSRTLQEFAGVATAIKIDTTVWVISGVGLT